MQAIILLIKRRTKALKENNSLNPTFYIAELTCTKTALTAGIDISAKNLNAITKIVLAKLPIMQIETIVQDQISSRTQESTYCSAGITAEKIAHQGVILITSDFRS